MKLTVDGLENYKPITAPSDIAGVPYETVKSITGVTQLEQSRRPDGRRPRGQRSSAN
jgi:hypothetical protein